MKTKRENVIPRSNWFISLLLLISSLAHAQDVLQGYVLEGLKSNVVVQQKSVSVKQAQQSLEIAKSYFLPAVNLLADYTSGEGGRSIALPVGDLLNPVYATLNQITQSDAFPQINNVEQNFFPKNFYDSRVRTSVPLINTDLLMNRTIQGEQVALKNYELLAYKRQLVFEIKAAYFNYLSAESATKILESALVLVMKNVDINESLLRNGKTLPANLLRSKSEVERVRAELNSVRNRAVNAAKYFNFLLNRDLNGAIDTNFILQEIESADTTSSTTEVREEIQMIRTVQAINQSTLRLNKLSRLPKVNAFLDLGSQASNWQWNGGSMYYLFGVQLSMPIFQGFRNNTTIRQNNLELEKTALNLTNTEVQFKLSTEVALNDLQTSRMNHEAAKEQMKAAQSYYNLVEKGYQQGVNSLIEFLDARNQLTTSQLQRNLKHYDVLTAVARLERESASYNLEQ